MIVLSYLMSGQPPSFSGRNAWSPGTSASTLWSSHGAFDSSDFLTSNRNIECTMRARNYWPGVGAPLSDHSGGIPSLPAAIPTRPGLRPNASQAAYFGLPPNDAPILSNDGSSGVFPNGVAPVTTSLLKSSLNEEASS